MIVDNAATSATRTLVVWIPMLDGDELPAAKQESARFADRPIRQFWDGEQRLGKEVARSLGNPHLVAWDIYLFYPPGAEWTDAGLPAPEAMLAQAMGGVVATPGLLPAAADQSTVPAKSRDRIVVVGEQVNLEALLGKAVAEVAKRHARS